MLSYGIVRVQKFKAGSVKGIEIHDRRDKEHSHTNKDIDFEKSKDNYDLHQREGTFRQNIKSRIEQLDLKKAVRKDAVVMAQVLVTSDKEFFDRLTPGQTKEFFKESYEFLKNRYGAENIISSTVHIDEKTPHMHFNFVPVTDDGRLSAKSILNRKDLILQHDDFYQEIGKSWGLDRGEREGTKKHLEVAEYKKVTTLKEVEVLEQQKDILQSDLNALQSDLAKLEKVQANFREIDAIQGKKSFLGSNITINQQDFDVLKSIAKKQVIQERNFFESDSKIFDLEKENRELRKFVSKHQEKNLDGIRGKMEKAELVASYENKIKNYTDYLSATNQLDRANDFIQHRKQMQQRLKINELEI